MLYRVYQDGLPADSSSFPFCRWPEQSNLHESLDKAVLYTIKWAYPVDHERALEMMEGFKMEIGVPIDMSMGEQPVMMEVREVVRNHDS